MKSHFLILIFFFGITFSIFAQKSERHTQFSPEFRVSYNMFCWGLAENVYGFGVGFYNAFFNQKRCNLVVGLEYTGLFDDNIVFFVGQETKSFNNYTRYSRILSCEYGEESKIFC